ncbi:hypothetical protein N7491_007369 [Penicillium cf. griseofulvum]|nr:hypothetical protein N7491_007369 [Penicillium cf. griseofulvum]
MVEEEGLRENINSPQAALATDAKLHDEDGWMQMVTFQRGSSPSVQRLIVLMAGQSWKDTEEVV